MLQTSTKRPSYGGRGIGMKRSDEMLSLPQQHKYRLSVNTELPPPVKYKSSLTSQIVTPRSADSVSSPFSTTSSSTMSSLSLSAPSPVSIEHKSRLDGFNSSITDDYSNVSSKRSTILISPRLSTQSQRESYISRFRNSNSNPNIHPQIKGKPSTIGGDRISYNNSSTSLPALPPISQDYLHLPSQQEQEQEQEQERKQDTVKIIKPSLEQHGVKKDDPSPSLIISSVATPLSLSSSNLHFANTPKSTTLLSTSASSSLIQRLQQLQPDLQFSPEGKKGKKVHKSSNTNNKDNKSLRGVNVGGFRYTSNDHYQYKQLSARVNQVTDFAIGCVGSIDSRLSNITHTGNASVGVDNNAKDSSHNGPISDDSKQQYTGEEMRKVGKILLKAFKASMNTFNVSCKSKSSAFEGMSVGTPHMAAGLLLWELKTTKSHPSPLMVENTPQDNSDDLITHSVSHSMSCGLLHSVPYSLVHPTTYHGPHEQPQMYSYQQPPIVPYQRPLDHPYPVMMYPLHTLSHPSSLSNVISPSSYQSHHPLHVFSEMPPSVYGHDRYYPSNGLSMHSDYPTNHLSTYDDYNHHHHPHHPHHHHMSDVPVASSTDDTTDVVDSEAKSKSKSKFESSSIEDEKKSSTVEDAVVVTPNVKALPDKTLLDESIYSHAVENEGEYEEDVDYSHVIPTIPLIPDIPTIRHQPATIHKQVEIWLIDEFKDGIWTFTGGKVIETEDPLTTAIRESVEECKKLCGNDWIDTDFIAKLADRALPNVYLKEGGYTSFFVKHRYLWYKNRNLPYTRLIPLGQLMLGLPDYETFTKEKKTSMISRSLTSTTLPPTMKYQSVKVNGVPGIEYISEIAYLILQHKNTCMFFKEQVEDN
jgi:hypothetical protein